MRGRPPPLPREMTADDKWALRCGAGRRVAGPRRGETRASTVQRRCIGCSPRRLTPSVPVNGVYCPIGPSRRWVGDGARESRGRNTVRAGRACAQGRARLRRGGFGVARASGPGNRQSRAEKGAGRLPRRRGAGAPQNSCRASRSAASVASRRRHAARRKLVRAEIFRARVTATLRTVRRSRRHATGPLKSYNNLGCLPRSRARRFVRDPAEMASRSSPRDAVCYIGADSASNKAAIIPLPMFNFVKSVNCYRRIQVNLQTFPCLSNLRLLKHIRSCTVQCRHALTARLLRKNILLLQKKHLDTAFRSSTSIQGNKSHVVRASSSYRNRSTFLAV